MAAKTDSLLLFFAVLLLLPKYVVPSDIVDENHNNAFKIEGRVDVTSVRDKEWMAHTRLFVDGGQFIGFLKNDGSFVINGLGHGSYIVEVVNPTFVFEPVRVDITSRGKARARRVDNVQPQSVKLLPYPLDIRERGRANYFMERETFRMKDIIFSPMMLMMVLPLLLIMVMPKLINSSDPETRKEMDNQFANLTGKGNNTPDLSEMLTNWVVGKKPAKQKAVKPKPR